jgi:hypothetical protein
MHKFRRFLIVGLSLLFSYYSSVAFGQNLTPPWVPIAASNEGFTAFFYQAEGIRFFGTPPQVVKFHLTMVKDQKMSTADLYEAICGSKTITINNSAPVSVAAESSVRRLILESLCGFSDENGRWLGLVAKLEEKTTSVFYWFLDISSLRKTSNPFQGYSIRAVPAAADPSASKTFTYQPSSIQEWVYSCLSPPRLVFKAVHSESWQPENPVERLSALGGVIRVLCSGQFPVAEQAAPINVNRLSDRSTNSLTMEDAKLKCKELGFKIGSENFGSCVLKLSKSP